MKTLKDFNFENKRVLVRCDFNVPLSEKGEILDDFRIKRTIPTISYLVKQGAKVILMCHLGRPDGKVIEGQKLTPIQHKLMEYLDYNPPATHIYMAPDCIGEEIEKRTYQMQPGGILLLENLRFHKEEKENDDNFAQGLAKLGDIYINDAFANSHRSHASMVGVPKYLPSGIGFLLEKEIKMLAKIMENPAKPLIAIIGGVKAETKARLINKISEIGAWVLIGGLIDKGIKEKNIQLKNTQKIVEPVDDIEGKDIGPKTIELFQEKIASAKTIFWAGPLGKVEEERFQKGSAEIAQAIIESGAFSVVGGGETVKFINQMNLTEKFDHVSTGGGAMLDFIADGKLVGIEALK